MDYDHKSVPQVSKARKENIGVHYLANSKGLLMSSRTKYVGIKYHWFRSNISFAGIDIYQIGSKNKGWIYLLRD